MRRGGGVQTTRRTGRTGAGPGRLAIERPFLCSRGGRVLDAGAGTMAVLSWRTARRARPLRAPDVGAWFQRGAGAGAILDARRSLPVRGRRPGDRAGPRWAGAADPRLRGGHWDPRGWLATRVRAGIGAAGQ